MDYTDPYFTVQEEVLKNLEAGKLLYEQWSAIESPKNVPELSDKIRQIIRGIEWDLEDIQETVSIVENNPSRFRLSDRDVSARRKFVRETREIVKQVKAQLELRNQDGIAPPISFTVTAAKPMNSSHSLANDTGPTRKSAETSASFKAPTDDTRPTVRNISQDPLSEQKEFVRHQDERLEQLGASISTLKGMSHRMGSELEDQVVLLDDFSSDMAHTESKLEAATKRTARLLHLSTDRRQWCTIGCLTLILIIILVLFAIL